MSGAGAALLAAARTVLKEVDGHSGLFEPGPIQAADCHGVIEAGPETDWSHKSGTGRELRVAVTVRTAGERSGTARAFADTVEAKLAQLSGEAGGWRIVSMQFLRSHIVRERKSGWAAVVEFRARMLRL